MRRDKEKKKGPIDFLVYSKGTQEVGTCGEVDGKTPGRPEHRAQGEETQVLCWSVGSGIEGFVFGVGDKQVMFHLSAMAPVEVAQESD